MKRSMFPRVLFPFFLLFTTIPAGADATAPRMVLHFSDTTTAAPDTATPPTPAAAQQPDRAKEAAAIVAAINVGARAAEVGIESMPILKPWTETKAGMIVMGCLAGAIVVTSAAGAASMTYAAWTR